ncbi:MAG: carbohydrate-binding domain-containing protein, partial [Bacteroidales bacterium]|nr:carbohydrate-binding domain-containing protein [Bacteroidales bacterium]
MKKILVLISVLFFASTLFAQNKLLYYSGGNIVFSREIENVDSVNFSPVGNAVSHAGDATFAFPISSIDSIVFYVPSLDGEDPSANSDDSDWIFITYNNGGAVSVVNPWSDRGIEVVCDGEDVTVNAASGTMDRTFVVAGTTTDGSLTISTDNRINLRLAGANITNPTGAAINVLSDKKVSLFLEDNSENVLSDGSASAQKASLQCEG